MQGIRWSIFFFFFYSSSFILSFFLSFFLSSCFFNGSMGVERAPQDKEEEEEYLTIQ
jgi:hypothetical protein